MPSISIRGLDEQLRARLKVKAAREGARVNTVVRNLIAEAVGYRPVKVAKRRYDDLDALAGFAAGSPESRNAQSSRAFLRRRGSPSGLSRPKTPIAKRNPIPTISGLRSNAQRVSLAVARSISSSSSA